MFRAAKKEDLKLIAEEIGGVLTPEMKVFDLKNLMENSDNFKADGDFVENIADSFIEERKAREAREEQSSSIEMERLNLERAKLNAGIERINFKKVKLESAHLKNNDFDNTNAGFVKQDTIESFISTVGTLTIPVPIKPELWNVFFASLERAFKTKVVPEELKSEILMNILGEMAAHAVVCIKDEELKDYMELKNIILREYESAPLICIQNFRKA